MLRFRSQAVLVLTIVWVTFSLSGPLGIRLARSLDVAIVVSVQPNSLAARSGLLPGDQICMAGSHGAMMMPRTLYLQLARSRPLQFDVLRWVLPPTKLDDHQQPCTVKDSSSWLDNDLDSWTTATPTVPTATTATATAIDSAQPVALATATKRISCTTLQGDARLKVALASVATLGRYNAVNPSTPHVSAVDPSASAHNDLHVARPTTSGRGTTDEQGHVPASTTATSSNVKEPQSATTTTAASLSSTAAPAAAVVGLISAGCTTQNAFRPAMPAPTVPVHDATILSTTFSLSGPLGIRLTADPDVAKIFKIKKGSPAAAAGLLPGDIICMPFAHGIQIIPHDDFLKMADTRPLHFDVMRPAVSTKVDNKGGAKPNLADSCRGFDTELERLCLSEQSQNMKGRHASLARTVFGKSPYVRSVVSGNTDDLTANSMGKLDKSTISSTWPSLPSGIYSTASVVASTPVDCVNYPKVSFLMTDEELARQLQREEFEAVKPSIFMEREEMDYSEIVAIALSDDEDRKSAAKVATGKLNYKLMPNTENDLLIAKEMQEHETEEYVQHKEDEEAFMQSSATGKARKFVEQVLTMVERLNMEDPASAGIVQPVAVDDMVFTAERLLAAQEEFREAGKPTVVDLGYHYTRKENLGSIQTNGLMTME
jgi:hypothetical protein